MSSLLGCSVEGPHDGGAVEGALVEHLATLGHTLRPGAHQSRVLEAGFGVLHLGEGDGLHLPPVGGRLG